MPEDGQHDHHPKEGILEEMAEHGNRPWGDQEHQALREMLIQTLENIQAVQDTLDQAPLNNELRVEGTILVTANGQVERIIPMAVVCTPNDTIEGTFSAKDAD